MLTIENDSNMTNLQDRKFGRRLCRRAKPEGQGCPESQRIKTAAAGSGEDPNAASH